MTWEPAENVPALVIKEFEQGSVTVVMDSTSDVGLGQTVHTLTQQAPSHHLNLVFVMHLLQGVQW